MSRRVQLAIGLGVLAIAAASLFSLAVSADGRPIAAKPCAAPVCFVALF